MVSIGTHVQEVEAMVDRLTPERLEELRRIAEAATPGSWASNMQYISTFDPPTVLALLNEIERLRLEREEDDDKWTHYEELYVQARGQIVDLQLEIECLRREREVMAAVLKAVHERDKHVHTCDHCECALCPEGTGLSYKAYIAQWIYSKGGGGA